MHACIQLCVYICMCVYTFVCVCMNACICISHLILGILCASHRHWMADVSHSRHSCYKCLPSPDIFPEEGQVAMTRVSPTEILIPFGKKSKLRHSEECCILL